VISAVASSIFNADVYGAVWDRLRGAPAGPSATAPSPSTPELVTRSNQRMSIIVRVPGTWATAFPHYDVLDFKRSPGDALASGTDPFGKQSAALTRFHVAASRSSLSRLEITSASDARAQTQRLVRSLDWTKDNCRLVRETPYPDSSYLGSMREWADCAGIADSTMWEAYAVDQSLTYLLFFQLTARGTDVDRVTSEAIMTSVQIDSDKLSG
jgi:hypothetical protein